MQPAFTQGRFPSDRSVRESHRPRLAGEPRVSTGRAISVPDRKSRPAEWLQTSSGRRDLLRHEQGGLSCRVEPIGKPFLERHDVREVRAFVEHPGHVDLECATNVEEGVAVGGFL